jgi:hypothetical protein
MSCLIATPVRGRAFDFQYVVGMLHASGAYGAWMPMSGQSDIYVARNTLAYEFLKSKHDDLIFIDSDIGYTKQNLQDLLASPAPYVSGLYPGHSPQPEWIFRRPDGSLMPVQETPESGMGKAKLIPCGFLKIHRSVFETIRDAGIVEEYGPVEAPSYQFFKGIIEDRFLLSEDYSFSVLARKAGIQPYVNYGIQLTHGGRKVSINRLEDKASWG